MTHFIRFMCAVCMVSVSEGYVLPNARNHHPIDPRNSANNARTVPLEQQTVGTGGSSFPVSPFALGMIAGLIAAVIGASTPAFAGDVSAGQGVFSASCAGCHAGGGNALAPDKKLTKEALEKFGKYDTSAIQEQVAKGKASMPAFGEKLSAADIENVSAYVIDQAGKGW